MKFFVNNAAGLYAVGFITIFGIGVGIANAQSHEIKITQPWTRATPKGASSGVAYATITNAASVPDRLIGITSPGAGKAEAHQMSMKGNVMKMMPMQDGLVIPAHGKAVLEPFHNHIMLENLKMPLKQGSSIPITLTFQHAGKVTAQFAVGSLGAMSAPRLLAGH